MGDGVEGYLLTVYDRDGEKYHVYGEDIKCSYVPDGSVEKLLKSQNKFQWFKMLLHPKEYEVPITMEYHQKSIAKVVSKLDSERECQRARERPYCAGGRWLLHRAGNTGKPYDL